MISYSYIDPYALFDFSYEEQLAGKHIRKKKREVLAEFELNDLAEIELGGKKMNKSEIIALFESFESETALKHYQQVAAMPSLKAFLVEGEIHLFAQDHWRTLLETIENDADFEEFLRPFFSYQFNEVSLGTFLKKDEDRLQKLFQFPLWMPVEHQQTCTQGLHKHLRLLVKNVEQVAAQITQGSKAPGPVVQEVVDENQLALLNALPASFEHHRNAYAKGLEELALGLFNSYQRAKLAKYILRQGLKLHINADTTGRLEYLLDQLLAMAPDDELSIEDIQEVFEKRKGKTPLWQWALGGLVAFVVLRAIL